MTKRSGHNRRRWATCLVVLGACVCGAAAAWRLRQGAGAGFAFVEWPVGRRSASSGIRQRGILRSADAAPAVVRTRGYILEIVKQGTPVKKGDVVFQMDDTKPKESVEEYESRIEQEELTLKSLRAREQFTAFQEDQGLAVKKAELEHGKLEEQVELNAPTPEELHLLGIERELAELALADAQGDYERQLRLFKKEFISAAALEPYERRLESAKAGLREVQIKIEVKKKGITRERRVELRRAVERAAAVVERASSARERKLAEIRHQIVASERQIVGYKSYLELHQKEAREAATHAARDGVVKVRRYRDWRSGGRLREYRAGVERYPQDIIADVIDPSVMKIDMVVNEADFHRLREGMAVRVTVPAFPGNVFPGKVQQLGAIGRDRNLIDPTAKGGGKSDITMFNAEILFNGKGTQFHPGMSAEVEIVVDEVTDGLLIPRAAVHRQDAVCRVRKKLGREYVWCDIEGRVFNDREFLVTAGLSEGDTIALGRLDEKTDISASGDR